MKRVVILAALMLASLQGGCMAYYTHKEVGFKRLWSFDVESVPTGQGLTTVPLVPQHSQHKPVTVPGVQSLPKSAAPVECLVLPAIKCSPTKTESAPPPCADATAILPGAK